MLTKDKIETFYEDVKSLNLRFPVAMISEATGEKKGNVSRYLSRKIEPSETFIEKFYDRFKIVPRNTNSLTNNTELHKKVNELELKVKKQGAYISLLVDAMAEVLHASSGESVTVLRRRIEHDAEELAKLEA